MVNSFKEYISKLGLKTAKVSGKRKSLYKTKNKKKIANYDMIEKAAKGMAIATKISGIKAVNYVEPAVGEKRLKILSESLSKEIGKRITASIVQEF
jgi:hypothetical protein